MASSAVRTTCSACGTTLVVERGGVVRVAEPPAGLSAPAPQLVVAMAPIAVPAPAKLPQLEGYLPTDDIPQLTGSEEFFLARQPPAEMRALTDNALPEFAATDLSVEPQHVATPAYGYSLATMALAQPNTFTAEASLLPPPQSPAQATPHSPTQAPPQSPAQPLPQSPTQRSPQLSAQPQPLGVSPPPQARPRVVMAAPSLGPTPALMFPSLSSGNTRPAREGATPEPFLVPHTTAVAPTAWPAPAPVAPVSSEPPQGFVSYAEPPPFNPDELAEADALDLPPLSDASDAVFADETLEPLPPIPVPAPPDGDAPEAWVQSAVTDTDGASSFADTPVDPRETEPTRHDRAANDDHDDFELPRRPVWPFVVAACVLIAGGFAVYAGSRHNDVPAAVAVAPAAQPIPQTTPPVVASAQPVAAPEPVAAPAPTAPPELVDNAVEPTVPSVGDKAAPPVPAGASQTGETRTPAASRTPAETRTPAASRTPAETRTPADILAAAVVNVPTPMLGPAAMPSAEAVKAPPAAPLDFAAATVAEPEPPLQTSGTSNKNAQACYNRGNRLLNQNKVWLATQELNNCLSIDPSYGRVYRSLGVAYMLLGRERASIQAYEKFVDAEPQHKDVQKVREIIADYYRRRKN